MRFVFLALMCVFAGIHAARGSGNSGTKGNPADFWDIAGTLFFSIAASLMYVLAAVGSRTGVNHEAYYVLILIGLCLSLASDIFSAVAGVRRSGNDVYEENKTEGIRPFSGNNITGGSSSAAGYLFSAMVSALYLGAFYLYAGFSWYDAALFAFLAALAGTLLYNMKRDIFHETLILLYITLLCAVTAKALSLLFVPGGTLLYSALAAAGAVMFAGSSVMRVFKTPRYSKPYNVLRVAIYYCAQGLIALSVMI